MELRWYQDEAISALFDYFRANTGNPLVAMPTGTGKSVVIAGFAKRALYHYPQTRIVMSVHVKELIEQNAKKLIQLWPDAPLGIHSAGLKQRDTDHQIIYGGVKSLIKYIPELGYRDLLLIDECQTVSDEDESEIRLLIDGLRVRNPYLKIIGLSATIFRMKLGLLTNGGIFTDVCYDLTSVDNFNRLIREGYLAPLTSFATDTRIDISNVKITAGEFNAKQIQAAVDKEEITEAATLEIINKGVNRNCWLIFGEGIEHAEHIAACMSSYGISAAAVHSKKSAMKNDEIITAFKTGAIKCLVNADKLTAGFDHPPIDLIGMIRHTVSPGLWVQMLGRGTRPYNGYDPNQYIPGFDYVKTDCLVLDFAQNLMRLGPINEPQIPNMKGKPTGDPPIKICETNKLVSGEGCGAYNYASVRYCWHCNGEFDFKPKIETVAASGQFVKPSEEVLPIVEYFRVDMARYEKHIKQGSLPTMKVTYLCNGGAYRFNEFVAFEHSGTARTRAVKWWQTRHAWEAPLTVDQALSEQARLRVPTQIRVWVNKKPYPEVLGYEY